tara:strand:+ start:42 stop:236 length:195 start_codon:yes stop_codon:yes gene_type:complete
LCGIQEKPTAQTAHLVFPDTQANTQKTKRAVFCQRSNKKMTEKFVELRTICKFDKICQLNNFNI